MLTQATCCQLHIAAMIAEYLKLKKVQSWGADAFAELSSNISQDETGLKLDSGWHILFFIFLNASTLKLVE